MNKSILYTITSALLFLTTTMSVAQAPNLGSTADFVLFSSDGAVENSGPSQLTGHVGTNNGSSTGFGNVNGVMHDNDLISAQASIDLLIAYNEINSTVNDFNIAASLGGGQTLVPGVYAIEEASTLNLDLILDGQGDPNAVFIFKINGTLSTNANAKVKLIDEAQACNVFWSVEGLVDMATGTTMRGTVIANNAGINMNVGDTLEGRALSTTGAISVDGVLAYTPIGCGSPTLNGPVAPTFGEVGCYGVFSSDGPVQNSGITNLLGDVGANVGLTTGFDPLLVTGNIHPEPDGSTEEAAFDLLVVYNYLNGLSHDIELLYPAQFGANLVLTPHAYLLDAATTFTDTVYLDAQENEDAVFVIKVNGAFETSSFSKVILRNGTKAENVYWLINGAVDIDDNSIFNGTIVSQGAINLYTAVTINGRILTGVGAIETNAISSAAMIPGDCDTEVGGDFTSINEFDKNQNLITIYPNPFKNETTIEIENASKSNQSVFRVYNSLGIEVINHTIINPSTLIDTSMLPSGMYFFKVTDNSNIIQTGKLVSQ